MTERPTMKLVAVFLLLAALFPACGCGKSNDDGYIDQLTKTHREAKDMAAILPARQCIEAFHALNGRYPKDLDELHKAYPELPGPPTGQKYDYNPKTGEIQLVPEK